MRILALGPIHGGTIAQRIQQMSREGLQVQQGSLSNLGAQRISWRAPPERCSMIFESGNRVVAEPRRATRSKAPR